MKPANLTALWGDLIIDELVRNGCDLFCISPGSRSTPLTVAAARHPHARTMIFYDERGAAFHALGYARATGKPAPLICTSGTAAANYLPAVIEADVDCVPMLILSADRPPELRDTMANQTIVQVGMFNRYVRWQVDLPVPTIAIPPEFVLTTIDQAVYRAIRPPHGPVHLNCMFREPLAPIPAPIPDEYTQSIAVWHESNSAKPYTTYAPPAIHTKNSPIDDTLKQLIEQTERGIIAVGQLKSDAEREAVLAFVDQLGWPVFPDVTSGLRLGTADHLNLIHYFDQLLLSTLSTELSTGHDERPDTIIHIGGQLVSKRFLQFTARFRPKTTILIKDSPERHDPIHIVTHRSEGVIHSLSKLSTENDGVIHRGSWEKWRNQWITRNKVIHRLIESRDDGLSEIDVARIVSATIPADHALFIGNSMPIRDMDMYAVADGARVPVAANRGASGIDGNVACGIGFGVGHGRPTTLIIGDLTFMHDLNALTLLHQVERPVTLIVINNGGGGIFHHLPIAQFDDLFEPYFGTPHAFQFGDIAKGFGVAHQHVTTREQFERVYLAAVSGQTHTVLEVQTDRIANTAAHKRLQDVIRASNYLKNYDYVSAPKIVLDQTDATC